MVSICPTITTDNEALYAQQVERIVPFAHRVHIDLGDGEFTPNKLLTIDKVWWPGGIRADLHVMYEKPMEHLPACIALGPQLIIVHAEAQGDFAAFVDQVHHHGIEAGVALLPQTPAEAIQAALQLIDHVLIFSGNLGYQGGSHADLGLLEKAQKIKRWRPAVEIGWDGGVNDQNVRTLVQGGVEVLNAGGFIQNAQSPAEAHATLKALVESSA